MYDIDKSPFNDLLSLQEQCMRVLGTTSYEYRRMEEIVGYWGHQDDEPPSFDGDSIADQVQSVIDGFRKHLGEHVFD